MKRKQYFLFIFCFFFIGSKAQNIEEQMTKERPRCNDVYLNAMDLFPKLYRNKSFDSMHIALKIWQGSCGNISEIQCTYLLLAFEQSTFTIDSINSSTINLLEGYSQSYYYSKQNPVAIPAFQKSFYRFSSVWARLLLEQNLLDENEKFICKVFTGEITDPVQEIKDKKETYPHLAAIVKKKEEGERTGNRSNYALLSGLWLPTGDLGILGNHPSIGFQVGFKGSHDQVDFTLQFRFLNSANKYYVSQNGSLFESSSYFGGYLGVDYTYYLLSKIKYEFGLLAGMGYDGFDVSQSENHIASIGSFNANGGLKFNYFVNPRFYLGIQGRYNWINYANRGGTSFNGDAFSIDFIIGGNSLKRK